MPLIIPIIIGIIAGIVLAIFISIIEKKKREKIIKELLSSGFKVTRQESGLMIDEWQKKWCIISNNSKSDIYSYNDILEIREEIGIGICDSVQSIYVVVYLKNGKTEKLKILGSNIEIKKDSIEYKKARQNADRVLALLKYIKGYSNIVEKQEISKDKNNTADEIRSFKKLLDDGIITETEFEEKKKQLLNK